MFMHFRKIAILFKYEVKLNKKKLTKGLHLHHRQNVNHNFLRICDEDQLLFKRDKTSKKGLIPNPFKHAINK